MEIKTNKSERKLKQKRKEIETINISFKRLIRLFLPITRIEIKIRKLERKEKKKRCRYWDKRLISRLNDIYVVSISILFYIV